MTKMQIVAKTALTVIGIHAIVLLLRHTEYLTFSYSRVKPQVSYLLLISVIIIIARLLIFKNNSFARRITGPGQELTPHKATSFLICSYRVAFVFYGLTLLSSSTRQFYMLMTIFNPESIRKWINHLIYGHFDFVGFCLDARDYLPHFIITILAFYLISGMPHLVRRNARYILTQTNQTMTEDKI